MKIDNSLKITPNPKIPTQIVEAYKKDKLVVFVGAGISRLVGCDGWDSLADKLIKNLFTPAEAEQILSSDLDQVRKITIAKQHAKKKRKTGKFWSIFKNAIKQKNKKDVYDIISQLKVRFITTNCDGLLVNKFENSYSTECDINLFNDKKGKSFVFCIHGNLKDGKDTLIFTIDEYLKAYKQNSKLTEFLNRALATNTVLFLGYGLNEFQILSAAFNDKRSNGDYHYLLDGFFEYEQAYVDALDLYYKNAGIQLIPYSKDYKSYEQQIDIIKEWIETLKQETSYSSDRVLEVRELVNRFDESSRKEINQLLKQNSISRDICFNAFWVEIVRSSNTIEWIEYLIDSSLISIDDIPKYNGGDSVSKTWDFVNCINKCIKINKFDINETFKLRYFLDKCIQIVANENEYLKNYNLIISLSEYIFVKGNNPTQNEEKILNYFISNSPDYGFYSIKENILKVKKWNDIFIAKIFVLIINSIDNNSSYLIDELYKLVIEYLPGMKNKIIIMFLERLIFKEKVNNFFLSIEDRFYGINYGLSYSLFKILDKYTNNKNNCVFIVKNLADKINNQFSNQFYLYLLRKIPLSNLDVIKYNPLNFYNSYVDFYYWLNEHKKELDSEDLNFIYNMVKEASFGFNYDNKENLDHVRMLSNTYKRHIFILIGTEESKATIDLLAPFYKDEKNPVEDKDGFIHYHSEEEAEFFEDSVIEKMNPDLFNELIEKLNSLINDHREFVIYDLISELFKKISKDQKEYILINSLNLKNCLTIFKTLNMNLLSNISHIVLMNYLDGVLNKLEDIDNNDEKDEIILNIARILEDLKKSDYKNEDIFELNIKILNKNILSMYNFDNSITDLFTVLLNDARCIVYSNLILIMQFMKEDKHRLDIFKTIIKRHSGDKYMVYSLAYKINCLAFVDYEWTKNYVFRIFNELHLKEVDLLITANSEIIYKDITDYLIDSKIRYELVELISKEKVNSFLYDNYLKYLVSAYVFEQIDDNDFEELLNHLDICNYYKIVRSIFECNEENNIKFIKINKIYNYLLIKEKNVIDFSCEIIKYISKNNIIDKKLWENVLLYSNSCKESDNWNSLNNILKKTKRNNIHIEPAIRNLVMSKSKPYGYILKSCVSNLLRIKNEESAKLLSNYAVTNVIEMQYFTDICKMLKDKNKE